MAIGEDVYCTLCMSDNYLPGAAVLAHSLRDSGTQKKLACLITPETLQDSTVTELRSLYNYVIPVERIGNSNPKNLYLMGRPDLLYTFTKINLWRLIQFRKIIYVDSDVVALRAPDELFDVKEDFAAAPDIGWPSAFNSGLLVLTPNMGEYWALKTMAAAGDSFDGADQGLLNQYFEHRPWRRLNFTYNVTPSTSYQYEPAYRYYKRDISMVHFIGSQKPWQSPRTTHGTSSAYQELLSRWWAVYDRHFHVSTHDYIYSQKTTSQAQSHVAKHVKDVASDAAMSHHATGFPSGPADPQESQAVTTEGPMSEPVGGSKEIVKDLVESTPTQEARKFSAPLTEWDATRSAPPVESKPEAANFPVQLYEFNTDPKPFRPPAKYPEPPKDMWFEMPKETSEKERKLAPIFPWEEHERPAPTRRFIEDAPPPTHSEPEPELEIAGLDEFEVQNDEQVEPKTPTIRINDETHSATLGVPTKNVWDEDEKIQQYVRLLTAFRKNRSKLQVLHHQTEGQAPPFSGSQILSPTNESSAEEVVERRRQSVILTDFPSAVERPSLPVTPAPIRRSTFWGEERDDEGDLPQAEGVPHQADWDPSAQLERLRHNSLIGSDDLKLPSKKTIPKRAMPRTAQHAPEDADSDDSNHEATGLIHIPLSRDNRIPAGILSSIHTREDRNTAEPTTTAVNTIANVALTFSEPLFDVPDLKSRGEGEEKALSPTQVAQS